MTENNLVDVQIYKKIVWHENKWQVQKKTITMKFNPIFRKWNKENTEIEYLPLTEWDVPLSKRIEANILIKRHAVDTYSLLPLEAYFIQKIVVETDKNNLHEYVNCFENRFFVHDLNLNVSQPLSVRDFRVKKVGEAKRVTEKEVEKLKKTGLQTFTETKEGLIIELQNF